MANETLTERKQFVKYLFPTHLLQLPNNKILANAELTGIDPAPRGVPRIAVNFYIDEKGSLNISAADKKTKKGHQIKILKRLPIF